MTRSRETGNVGYRAYKKNYLINGDFSVWQRGSSFTLSSSDGVVYTADRFQALSPHDGQTTVLEGLAWLRLLTTGATSGPNGTYVMQKIEDYNRLRGREVTASYLVYSNVACNGYIRAYTVVGGIESSIILSPPMNIPMGSSRILQFTFTVPDSGANSDPSNFVMLQFFTDELNDDLFIYNAQLEDGTSATDFEYVSPQEQLAACQRYYSKMGTSAELIWSGDTTSGARYHTTYFFPTDMRAVPTLTVQNADAGGFPATPSTIGAVSETAFRVSRVANTTAAAQFFQDSVTADAEL